MRVHARRVFVMVCGTAAVAVMAGAVSLVISRPAAATMQYAQETGKPCTYCHTDVSVGPALSPAGEAFKANGNKLPK